MKATGGKSVGLKPFLVWDAAISVWRPSSPRFVLLERVADGLRAGISAYCHRKEAFGRPSAAHAPNCPLCSQPFGQSYASRLCQHGCATQNWGQGTCKALAGILKSPVPPQLWPEGFSRCCSLFRFGNCYKQNQSKCRNPQPDPKPQQTSSAERVLPAQTPSDSASKPHLIEARPNP